MEIEFRNEDISFKKEISVLDDFTFHFTEILTKHEVKYVIVSGYVAILFGRSRMSEDVDILIEPISHDEFLKLWSELEQTYECLITSNPDDAYHGYLENHNAIRFAQKGNFIPNMEMKFVKNDLDRYSMKKRKHVKLNDRSLFISPLELQIPYKLFLGSKKDVEDARFLFKLFKDELDLEVLNMFLDELDIPDECIEKYLGDVI